MLSTELNSMMPVPINRLTHFIFFLFSIRHYFMSVGYLTYCNNNTRPTMGKSVVNEEKKTFIFVYLVIDLKIKAKI